VWNFLVCLAIDLGGKGMPMTGMHFKTGNFFVGYMKCVNKTTAETMGKQVATHMVVLLSNAFFQSPMCMVEVHHAIRSRIKLVLVAIEELEWPIEEKAWLLDTSRTRFPFSDGTVKWGDAEFASNRAAVLAEVTGGNSYPRPGSVTTTWAQNGGFDVLSWIVSAVGGSLGDSEELIEAILDIQVDAPSPPPPPAKADAEKQAKAKAAAAAAADADKPANAEPLSPALEAWLEDHGLRGKKLEKIVAICEKELIETPDELRKLHEKDELKDVFKQAGLRISIEEALQADGKEEKVNEEDELSPGSTVVVPASSNTSSGGSSAEGGHDAKVEWIHETELTHRHRTHDR
jgi:hypothetical protein